MKIVHRIGFAASEAQRRALEALGVRMPPGIEMPGGGIPFIAFDVAEEHPNWNEVRSLLLQWDVSEGFVRTEFTNREIAAARWLELGAWHHGYPQPKEEEFGYLAATYDLSDYCPDCGTGKKQNAPFQMKGEPRWGRRGILQLNWVFDEYFVTPAVWSSVFEPHGIGCRPVLNRKLAELKTVVQLVVEEQAEIKVAGLPSQTCGRCGRVKYLPHTRGFFPPLVNEPEAAMAKTSAVFGDGASAHHAVLVSQNIARALSARKVKGASFKPVDAG